MAGNCNTTSIIKKRIIAAANGINGCMPTESGVQAFTSGMLGDCQSIEALASVVDGQIQRALCYLEGESESLQNQIDNLPDVFTGLASAAEQGITEDIYISIRTDGVDGTGTIWDQYDGSTAEKLDALFPTLPENARIHFGPGIFNTTTGLPLKEGQSVSGVSKWATVVRLSDGSATATLLDPTPQRVIFYRFDFQGYLNYAAIRNIGLDGNLDNQPIVTLGQNGSIGLIAIAAEHGFVEGCNLIGGYAVPGEGFPVTVYHNAANTADSPFSGVIRNNYFRDFRGYISIATVYNGNAGLSSDYTGQWTKVLIENNILEDSPTAIGFGAGGWDGAIIRNNILRNVGTFMVQDTHKGHNVLVEGNIATGLRAYGILINGNNVGQYRNYRIINNTFKPDPASEATFQHVQVAAPDMLAFDLCGNTFDSGTAVLTQPYFAFNVRVGQRVNGTATTLAAIAVQGAMSIVVTSATGIFPGQFLLISDGNTLKQAFVRVGSGYVSGTTIPLESGLPIGQLAGATVKLMSNLYSGNIRDNRVSDNLYADLGEYPIGCAMISNRKYNGDPVRDSTITNLSGVWYREGSLTAAGTINLNLGEFSIFNGAQILVETFLTGGSEVGDSATYILSIRQSGEVSVRLLSHARNLTAGLNAPVFETKPNAVTGLWALFASFAIGGAGGVKLRMTGTPLQTSDLAYTGGVKTLYSLLDVVVSPPRRPCGITAGAGAGVGAVVTIVGNSKSGYIDVTAAGAPTAGGIIGTVVFGSPADPFPAGWIPIVIFTPKGNVASGNYGIPWVSVSDANGFVFNAKTAPLVAATSYGWFYSIDNPFDN